MEIQGGERKTKKRNTPEIKYKVQREKEQVGSKREEEKIDIID
jgi:hypothetical protein